MVNLGHSSWVLRSVCYHVNEPAVDAAFSEDGSLLAVAYNSVSNLSSLLWPDLILCRVLLLAV